MIGLTPRREAGDLLHQHIRVVVQFGKNVRQTSVCRQNFDKLKLVGHQTAPLPHIRRRVTAFTKSNNLSVKSASLCG